MPSQTENSSFQERPADAVSLVELFANSVFESVLALFVVWTIMSQAGRIFHYSFTDLREVFSYLLIPLLLMIGKAQSLKWQRTGIFIDKAEIHAAALLGLLMLVCATLALGAIRPDADDVDYTSQIVYFFNYPDRPLDLLRHDHALVDMPFHWPIYIFYSLELFCAYFAWLFAVPFLDVFYFALPVIGGLLLPLGWFSVYSRFTRRTIAAVLAATAVCVFLSVNGFPHRAFGNFALVRIWQGKTLLMSILSPVFIAFAIDYFRASTVINWLRLTTIMIAGSGITAMSAFFLPFLSVAGIGYWLTRENKSLKQLAWFFGSFFYLILVAVYFKAVVNPEAIKFHGEDGWPTTFDGQFKLLFSDYLSWPSVSFALFTGLSLLLAKTKERQFLLYWLIGVVGLFLNPLVFPLISAHVTSLNNYWRLFYLLPFPFTVGFVVIALQQRLPTKPIAGDLVFVAMALFSLVANTFPNRYSHYYATFGKVRYAFGSYKISPESESDIKDILAKATPGIMIAPLAYSALVPIYSSQYPQVSVRHYMLMSLEAGYGSKGVAAKQKLRAVDYFSGSTQESFDDAASLLNKNKYLMSVIVNPKSLAFANWPKMAETLAKNGYTLVLQKERFLLYTKLHL